MHPTMQTLQTQLQNNIHKKTIHQKTTKKPALQALQTNLAKYIQVTNNNTTQKKTNQ